MWFASHGTELLPRNPASVNYAKFFRAPCRKNNALDQKMDDTFLMVSTSSITMQRLEKIAQCAPAVGAKMWFLFFCFFWSRSESGALCVRGVHSSNKHCIAIYWPISTRLTSFFHQMHFIVLTIVARWRHNFREIEVMRSKIVKSPKIGGKYCVHHFI